MSKDDTFDKSEAWDEPELVGAQWWRRALDGRDDNGGIDRRSALLSLAGLSAASVVGGSVACWGGSPRKPKEVEMSRSALQTQKQHGWSFGAENVELHFMGTSETQIAKKDLDNLVTTLAPKNSKHLPYYGPVLFQSVTATPTTPAASPGKSLAEVIQPMFTPRMDEAEMRGRGLSTLFRNAPPGRMVVIDLPGPQAVAFAAGLANRFDPVFYFDNWPHPRGVVASHLTLAAALHYLPWFEKMRDARGAEAPAVFVLDSNRLTPFNDHSRFDNRYVAHLPKAAKLKAQGVKEVLYVRPKGSDRELEDLNALFVEYRAQGLDIKLIAADAFIEGKKEGAVDPKSGSPEHKDDAYATKHEYYGHHRHHYYGGLGSHWFFFSHYGWGRSGYAARQPRNYAARPRYAPVPRQTAFGPAGKRPRGFGQVNVKTGPGGRTSLSSSQVKRTTTTGTRRSGSSSRSGSRTAPRSSWGRSSGGRSGS